MLRGRNSIYLEQGTITGVLFTVSKINIFKARVNGHLLSLFVKYDIPHGTTTILWLDGWREIN